MLNNYNMNAQNRNSEIRAPLSLSHFNSQSDTFCNRNKRCDIIIIIIWIISNKIYRQNSGLCNNLSLLKSIFIIYKIDYLWQLTLMGKNILYVQPVFQKNRLLLEPSRNPIFCKLKIFKLSILIVFYRVNEKF